MSTGDSKEMNCEEFKQAVAADPSFDGATHVRDCVDCAAYQADMRAFDQKIIKALELQAPPLRMPDLPEIDSANVVTLPGRKVITPWLAVAATVVIAAVVGIRMLGSDLQADSLRDQIIAHLDHEPNSLRVTSTPISDARLNAVVSSEVGEMDRSAGLITYAKSCSINGKSVPHLVIQGEFGPITILLMPDEYVAEASSISGESVSGVILPVGKGSIAIIGDTAERMDEIQKRVVDSVTWGT
jgi:hypothetical protein